MWNHGERAVEIAPSGPRTGRQPPHRDRHALGLGVNAEKGAPGGRSRTNVHRASMSKAVEEPEEDELAIDGDLDGARVLGDRKKAEEAPQKGLVIG